MRKPDRRTLAPTKICRDCRRRKTLDQFYLTSYARKHGTKSRMPYCKKCYSKRGKAYYAENRDAMNARSRASVERRLKEDPEGFRRSRINTRLKKTYGITVEQWETLHQSQNGKCKICKTPVRLSLEGKQHCCVDHNHACCPGQTSCGQCVRGILCTKCNWGLGQFDDDPIKLQAAIDYLAA